MKLFLVTVRFPEDPNHDPRNKVTGECPLTSGDCTDVTGAHHTMLIESDGTAESVREEFATHYRVTRVEEVPTGNYLGRSVE